MNTNVTNINITSNNASFPYLIEYIGSDEEVDSYDISWTVIKWNEAIELGSDSGLRRFERFGSYWEYTISHRIYEFIPKSYKKSKIRVYFPDYSVDTFHITKYAFDINTWVNGNMIILGSYLLSRQDALACKPIKKGEHIYVEYIEVDIVDPYELIYSDDWKDFRLNAKNYINEKPLIPTDSLESNNEGSSINFALTPVEEDERSLYVPLTDYDGGQSSMYVKEFDFLELKSNFLFNDEIYLHNEIIYNKVYPDLMEYMKETYNFTDLTQIKYTIIIKDKDNIYGILEGVSNSETLDISRNEIKNEITGINFNNWNEYIDGMFIMVIVTMIGEDSELLLRSNEIPLTTEITKYLIGDNIINKIELNNDNLSDMKVYNINTVNKVINNVIQMGNPNESKANLIQPIFFNTREINNLIIHPAVTENICINLDSYKYLVNSFVIQIEGKTFIEKGRTAAGVIFKIVGPQLPKNNQSGVYYILNENAEVVTSGKYNYVY